MKPIVSYTFTAILLFLASCTKVQTGGYTKSQVDSAVKVHLDSFANTEKRLLDSMAYREALSGSGVNTHSDTIAPALPHPNKSAHIPFDRSRIDTHKNAVPHSILDEQFK